MSAWHGRDGRPIAKKNAFGIMGILNVTPDSFYDGGSFFSEEAAVGQAGVLLADGADIIDIGAESTRPGATPVSSHEEWQRLQRVFTVIRRRYPAACLSVDTRHAHVADMALQAGASIVNDVSGCSHEPELLDVLAQYKPAYVLMHSKGKPQTMQDNPCYANVMEEITSFFEKAITRLINAGLPENRIVLDPGIGFGKTLDHNLQIMRKLGELLAFGRPLLIGISMKSFLDGLLGLPLGQRREATNVVSALLFSKGATWHRVHDAASARVALRLASSLEH